MSTKDFHFNFIIEGANKLDNGPFDTKFNRQEVWVVLRALAAYNSLPDTAMSEIACATWIVDRLLKLLPETSQTP